MPELEALPIVTQYRYRMDALDAQCREVIDDCPRGTWTDTDADYLVSIQPGFERRFSQIRVDIQVSIQEQISEDGDRQARQIPEDSLQTLFTEHGPISTVYCLLALLRRPHGTGVGPSDDDRLGYRSFLRRLQRCEPRLSSKVDNNSAGRISALRC